MGLRCALYAYKCCRQCPKRQPIAWSPAFCSGAGCQLACCLCSHSSCPVSTWKQGPAGADQQTGSFLQASAGRVCPPSQRQLPSSALHLQGRSALLSCHKLHTTVHLHAAHRFLERLAVNFFQRMPDSCFQYLFPLASTLFELDLQGSSGIGASAVDHIGKLTSLTRLVLSGVSS